MAAFPSMPPGASGMPNMPQLQSPQRLASGSPHPAVGMFPPVVPQVHQPGIPQLRQTSRQVGMASSPPQVSLAGTPQPLPDRSPRDMARYSNEALGADDNVIPACGSLCSLEDGGTGAKNEESSRLSYVGDGRGSYHVMEDYSFVGRGGSWVKETVVTYHGMQPKPWLMALLLLFGLAFVFIVCVFKGYISLEDDELTASSGLNNFGESREAVPTSVALSVSMQSTTVPFVCEMYGPDAEASTKAWPREKKAWCCQNKGVACTTTIITSAPVAGFSCDAGAADQVFWSSSQKAWCCSHKQVGCTTQQPPVVSAATQAPIPTQPPVVAVQAPETTLPAVPTPLVVQEPLAHITPAAETQGCDAICGGQGLTCKAKIEETVNNKFSGQRSKSVCALALGHVLVDCPTCSSCSPQNSGCIREANSEANSHSSGPNEHATTTYPAEPSDPDEHYDCQTDYANRNLWPRDKQVWCCQHQGKGCKGGSSRPFDCLLGLANWRNMWSLEKKTWCCINDHKGCPDG